MKKTRTIVATAALTLALVAAPALALAASFQVTNSSGGTIKVNCTTGNASLGGDSAELANGSSTAVFTCSGQIETTQKKDKATSYTFSHSCTSSQTQKTTVSAGSTDTTLSLSHSCTS